MQDPEGPSPASGGLGGAKIRRSKIRRPGRTLTTWRNSGEGGQNPEAPSPGSRGLAQDHRILKPAPQSARGLESRPFRPMIQTWHVGSRAWSKIQTARGQDPAMGPQPLEFGEPPPQDPKSRRPERAKSGSQRRCWPLQAPKSGALRRVRILTFWGGAESQNPERIFRATKIQTSEQFIRLQDPVG